MAVSMEADRPAALARIAAEDIVAIDVRAELRAGREPFSLIMAAHARVPAGGALCVRAIFEPVPLYRVMQRHGYDHHTEQIAADDWRVWFFPAETETADPPPTVTAAADAAAGDDLPAAAVVLDVRGLEPPAPMVRTLAALEALPEGATLVQLNVRVPQFLLPVLAERGYSWEIREQSPELVRLFIRRSPAEGNRQGVQS